jgi:hypothetical protein
MSKAGEEDGLEEEYLLQNIIGGENDQGEECCAYVMEYQDAINIMSRLCSVIAGNSREDDKAKKVRIE